MTDQEKSKKLAKLCNIKFYSQGGYNGEFIGWQVRFGDQWIDGYHSTKNLYSTDNMALAWRVLNWRVNIRFFDNVPTDAAAKVEFNRLLLSTQDLPPEKAIREWMDAVYALAIEAGLID